MSGTPNKRLHEEAAGGGGGSTGGSAHASGSSKYPHDNSSAGYPSSVVPKMGQEYHHSHPHPPPPPDHMGDVRMPPKIPRNDPSRSPLPPAYHHRVSLASGDVHPDHHHHHTVAESKDNPRGDSKGEFGRDLYQSGKDSKGDDNKYERDRDAYHFDHSKAEKEGFGAGNSHLDWKESKEHHHRGRRYPDAAAAAQGANLDPWRGSMHAPGEREISKEGSTVEERDFVDPRETVGENRLDSKGEDRFRDKDRKRKDLKHRDWGEKDNKDRIERRNNLQMGGGNGGDGKEPGKEERDTDRWERERKDLPKDKERLKEREKDHPKRETWNVAEKDAPHNEKELADVPGRTSEPEHLVLEQKKQKDHDGWKIGDREVKERRKERDADTEGERPEKRSRGYEKESDDGCADAEGGGDKERESFNYGVQQRKRMLRPRGSPQVGNREPRFKSRTQDNEG